MTWGEIWGYYTDGLFKDDAEAAAYPIDQKYVNNAINGSAGSERGIRAMDNAFGMRCITASDLLCSSIVFII